MVYGRLFCRGQSCRKALMSICSDGQKSSNSSRKVRRTPSPVNHWYVCLSSARSATTFRSSSLLTNAASFFKNCRPGAWQRSQYNVNASRTVHGVGKGFFTGRSTPLARTNPMECSKSPATPKRSANQSTVSVGFRGNTSKLSAVRQSIAGMDLTSMSRCFVVFPAVASATCRSSRSDTTAAKCDWKYHFPKMSAPPTCTKGSTGNFLASSCTSARSCNEATTLSAVCCWCSWLASAPSLPHALRRAGHKPFSFHCSKSSSMFWSSSPTPNS
mmetsp:Transcript_115879/g.324085  ORF Transcript_115879/g.324085 Transcript_115879/m.324085 type:complete len:272 (-) Transcript_115879:565-1380(-)